jgi:hypothetical protein
MSTAPDKIPLFSGTLRERIIVALVAPVLALVCIWCFQMIQPALGDTSIATPGNRFVLDIFHFLCVELFGGAIVFLMLAFMWALFRPTWILRIMTVASHYVWRAVCTVVLVMLAAAIIGSLIRHVG